MQFHYKAIKVLDIILANQLISLAGLGVILLAVDSGLVAPKLARYNGNEVDAAGDEVAANLG